MSLCGVLDIVDVSSLGLFDCSDRTEDDKQSVVFSWCIDFGRVDPLELGFKPIYFVVSKISANIRFKKKD